MAKRPFLESDDPPAKRRHISSLPSPTSSPSPKNQTTPHTPPSRRYSRPSDSPTNPFGRKRSRTIPVPHPTFYSKHLTFRFQLIRNDGRRRDREGVYRIAQVPLNYTFRHLHKLLYFLFDGPLAPPASTTSPAQREVEAPDGSGHLFEAQKSAAIYSLSHKAGQIKSAQTWARLSCVRDPYRYHDDEMPELPGGRSVFQADEEADKNDGDNESEVLNWRWEAEEDFTLAHVWPRGADLTKAITYVRFFLAPFFFSSFTDHLPKSITILKLKSISR